jgi:glutathione S-transferase
MRERGLTFNGELGMFKLYYHPGACSLAVHILLEWIGEPYELEKVDFGSKDYLKINPAGAVPALDTGEGWILTQDAAVLRYLTRRFPHADLCGGEGLREQAEVERWSYFITGDLHPAFAPLFVPTRYTTAKDETALQAVREAAVALVKKRFALLEDHLAGREFFVGNKRSYLDAYVFAMQRWGAQMLPDGLAPFPNIRAHHDRTAADPIVQRVLAAEGLE